MVRKSLAAWIGIAGVVAWAGGSEARLAPTRSLGDVRVGDRIPDLELPRIDGTRSMRLSELRGTKLLLIEFASW